MSCLTCHVVGSLNSLAENYAIKVFNTLAPNCLHIFEAFIGLWFVCVLVNNGIIHGNLKVPEFIKSIFIFVLVASLLNGHSLFWEFVYTPAQKGTIDIVNQILKVGVSSNSASIASKNVAPEHSIYKILEEVETTIMQTISVSEKIYSGVGWSPMPYIMGIILMIPYLFLWSIFFIYTLDYLIKFMVIGAIAPLLIICLGFSVSRSKFFAGINIILHSCLTLIMAVIVMSLSLVGIREVSRATLGAPGGIIPDAAIDLLSPTGTMSVMVVIAIASIYFQLKVPTIASNITGSQDGPGAAAGAAGLMATSMSTIKMRGQEFLKNRTPQALNIGARMATQAYQKVFNAKS